MTSEIDLGKLPPGWSWARVDSISSVSDGVHKKPDYQDSGVPFLTVRNLTAGDGIDFVNVKYITQEAHEDYIRRTHPEKGDILISKDGTLGVVRQIVTDDVFSIFVSLALVKPHNRDFSDYFELAFNMPQVQEQMSGTGTGLQHIHLRDLRSVWLPVPPLNEQIRIVAKSQQLLARRRATKKALDAIPPLLERFRQSVLAAAFRGDLTADWRRQNPNVEPASVLLDRIRAERRQRWEEAKLAKMRAKGKEPKDDKWKEKYGEPERLDTSDLPELPESWCWEYVGLIGEIQGGIQKQPSRIPKQNAYPFLRVANVQENRLDLQDVHQIELFEGELTKLQLRSDDLLIVEGNGSPHGIGRMAVWDGSIADCVHQNHLIRVRTAKEIDPHYVCAFWQSPTGRKKVFEQAKTTTGLFTLSVQKISTLPIPVAPWAEQQQIKRITQQALQSIERYRETQKATVRKLEQLAQSILSKAFRGELVPQNPLDVSTSKV